MVSKIISVIILFGISLILKSCFLFGEPDDTKMLCSRLIVNQLNQSITLKFFSAYSDSSQQIEQDSSWYMEEKLVVSDKITFEGTTSALDSVMIYSVNGKVLKVWRKSEKQTDERNFFDEGSWQKREWKENGYTVREWIFKLLPEDLQN